MEVDGFGLHRLWWDGGRYVYATALLARLHRPYPDDRRPRRADAAGRGRPLVAAGHVARPAARPTTCQGRVALHHAIVAGDTAYAAWRNGGITLLDVNDKSAPKLIAHRNWCPPFGGNTHTALPLPDRDLLVVDDEASADIAVEPRQAHLDLRHPRADEPGLDRHRAGAVRPGLFRKGGQFGPHNLWENRPDAFQSSGYVFATYQSAGPAASSTSATRSAPRRSATSCRRRRRARWTRARRRQADAALGRPLGRPERAHLPHRLQRRALHPAVDRRCRRILIACGRKHNDGFTGIRCAHFDRHPRLSRYSVRERWGTRSRQPRAARHVDCIQPAHRTGPGWRRRPIVLDRHRRARRNHTHDR